MDETGISNLGASANNRAKRPLVPAQQRNQQAFEATATRVAEASRLSRVSGRQRVAARQRSWTSEHPVLEL
jgi:hypothetical protein